MSDQVELRTERLRLRLYKLDDVDDVYAYAKDPEWSRYLGDVIPQPYTRRDAEEFVARSVLTSRETVPILAIVYESRVIGGIHLDVVQRHEIAALGYGLARAHWGMRLMPEAARAVIDWGFSRHGLAKIYATADLRNVQSHRVMEKVGMTREGVLRSHRKNRGERVDDVCYGILREEWEAARDVHER